MKRLGSYVNGNYTVHIFDDGTKIRINNLDHLIPAFPESIDMKICNRCDMGCPMCHEQSVPDGALADLNHPILDTLQPYTELALGGGNPLEHPDLPAFLMRMKEKGVICNLTVHLNHFLANAGQLYEWCANGLLHGIGISISSNVPASVIQAVKQFPNAVVHVIAGIAPLSVYESLYDQDIKLLILGYKDFGRGFVYGKSHPDLTFQISDIASALPAIVKHFPVVSFDNLAIKQLDVKKIVPKEKWDTCYMGDDGQFTMYIDLVQQQYAISSTSPRHDLTHDTIADVFQAVKEESSNGRN